MRSGAQHVAAWFRRSGGELSEHRSLAQLAFNRLYSATSHGRNVTGMRSGRAPTPYSSSPVPDRKWPMTHRIAPAMSHFCFPVGVTRRHRCACLTGREPFAPLTNPDPTPSKPSESGRSLFHPGDRTHSSHATVCRAHNRTRQENRKSGPLPAVCAAYPIIQSGRGHSPCRHR